MHSFYQGNYIRIAELTQNFASKRLWVKYAATLEKLWSSADDQDCKEEETSKHSCEAKLVCESKEPSDQLNKSILEQCFLSIRMELHHSLQLHKIEFISKMLKKGISREVIIQLFDGIDRQYLDIVSKCTYDNLLDIYNVLVKDGAITFNETDFDYRNLDYNEARIYHILSYYFNYND